MDNEVVTTEILADALAKARREAGLTQVEVARALGVDKRTLCSYEKGRLRVHGQLLLKLAAMYNLSLDHLAGKEYPKIDGRTRKAALLRRLELLVGLPEGDQALVLSMIDSLAAKQH